MQVYSEKNLLAGKCSNEVKISRYGSKVALPLAAGGDNFPVLPLTQTNHCKVMQKLQ